MENCRISEEKYTSSVLAGLQSFTNNFLKFYVGSGNSRNINIQTHETEKHKSESYKVIKVVYN